MQSIDAREFFESLCRVLGEDAAARAIEAMKAPASVSVRLNPFKKPDSELPILSGAAQVAWNPLGFLLQERPSFTMHPLFHAGAYYVQDSSAMFPGWLFRQILPEYKEIASERPVRVLDLCAAPGGKTTDLAASLREAFGDSFVLVSNEVMRARASVLSDNVAIWGDPNVVVTSVDPKAFASLPGFFDVIVTDVPCSGEGMFRKDAKAVADWSPELVQMCAARQRRILADVWPSLRAGGHLVYSTCTFEPEENDLNLQWVADELGGSIIPPSNPFGVRTTECGHLLVPGEVPGEGQWAGMLVKDGSSEQERYRYRNPLDELKRLRPLRMGVSRGSMKGHDLVPDADWALSLDFDRNAYPGVPVDKMTALHFLHRDTIALPDAPRGYLYLTYRGLPLGFVKNIGSRCNNLHPQSRRILKSIEP